MTVAAHVRRAARAPETRAVAAALAMHMGLGALFALGAPATSPDPSPPTPNFTHLEIDLVPLPKTTEPGALNPSKSPRSGPDRTSMPAPRAAARARGKTWLEPKPHTACGVGETCPHAEQGAAESGAMAGGGHEGHADGGGAGRAESVYLGMDRKMVWAWTRPEAPASPPRPASTSGGLHESLDAHDRTVGLGFSGPVVSAFHSVAYDAATPRRGTAVFEAIINRLGRLESVRLVSVDADWAAWEALADHVGAALRAKKLRTPPSGGVAITLELESAQRLPAGGSGFPALGFTFDLSNIGSVPAHVVEVRVLSERRL